MVQIRLMHRGRSFAEDRVRMTELGDFEDLLNHKRFSQQSQALDGRRIMLTLKILLQSVSKHLIGRSGMGKESH